MDVLPYMKRRKLIGSDNTWNGVKWFDENDKSRLLFSFNSMEWQVPKGVSVLNVQNGDQFITKDGIVNALPWQIYIWHDESE